VVAAEFEPTDVQPIPKKVKKQTILDRRFWIPAVHYMGQNKYLKIMRKYSIIYITHNVTAIKSRLHMYGRCTQQLPLVTVTGTQVTNCVLLVLDVVVTAVDSATLSISLRWCHMFDLLVYELFLDAIKITVCYR
jgi:hypothetical protein